ncbi:MAG TPA: hypothetical protein EYP25_10995 [Anaerolineae bacterium]|nr:hypothetical protein [Anaerolineae bacterium]HIQ12255.1 hypothetical protein [Caldilineales bacterium]
MNAPPPESNQRYKPKTTFYIYAALFSIAILWLGSEAWKRREGVWWIMFAGVGFIAIRMILASFARAEFDGETFVYRTPLRKPHRVDRQQLALVEMGGRRNEALIIGYHPRDDKGLVTIEKIRYINCVPLEGQGELMDRLLAAMPPSPSTSESHS